jgi:hypothetical protein
MPSLGICELPKELFAPNKWNIQLIPRLMGELVVSARPSQPTILPNCSASFSQNTVTLQKLPDIYISE